MATIINFTAKLNERRASVIVKQREEDKETAIVTAASTAAQAIRHGDFDTFVEQVAKAAELQKEPDFMPAYCDPNNEFRGSKHEATKNLSVRDLPALMREDIKNAKKRGQLPKDLKVSVRRKSCTHSWAIDIRITGLPVGQSLYNPDFVEATGNLSHPVPWGERIEPYTPEVTNWLKVLKEIHTAYQRDNSDSMSDYFSVRYYGDVGIYWELESAIRKSYNH